MFEWLFGNKSEWELYNSIEEAHKHNQLLDASIFYLEGLLEKKAKDSLTGADISYIQDQLENHKKLKEKYSEFLDTCHWLMDSSKEELQALFTEYQSQDISETELDNLDNELEEEQEKLRDSRLIDDSYRDYVEENIEWVVDDNKEDGFITQFTLRYFNYVHHTYWEDAILQCRKEYEKNWNHWLIGTRDEFLNILIEIWGLQDGVTQIKIQWVWEPPFSFTSKEIQEIIDIRKKSTDEEYILKRLIDWIELNDDMSVYISDEYQDENWFLRHCLEKWYITDSELLLYREKKEDFLYGDHLELFGLTSSLQALVCELVINQLWWKTARIEGKKVTIDEAFLEKNKKNIIHNICIFIQLLLEIESYGWKNVDQSEWISTARGYFQFKNEVWIDGKKKAGYTRNWRNPVLSSFETALRRTNQHLTGNKYPDFTHPASPDWLNTAWENTIFDPKDLSAEQQTYVWLCDTFMRSKKYSDVLIALICGNIWWARRVYEDIHHTSKKGETNKRTEAKMNTALPEYQDKFIQIY